MVARPDRARRHHLRGHGRRAAPRRARDPAQLRQRGPPPARTRPGCRLGTSAPRVRPAVRPIRPAAGAQRGDGRRTDPALAAGRIAATGCAVHLPYQILRELPDAAGVVRSTMDKLLHDPGVRTATTALRAEIESQPPPSEVVPRLERMSALVARS